jgi:indolepyruvate ferredoxin oxidoreductase beta subunit
MSTQRPGIDRPLTIVIAAMGGEGGGLLSDWIVEGAKRSGILVQSTSIPGVAQRTGATSYYLEMMRLPAQTVEEPVFGLYPAPGHIDIAVASELIEAGRLLEKGFVSPDRTTLIASTHRVYAMDERTAMADGSFDTRGVMRAAQMLACMTVIDDLERIAIERNTALNAIVLGAIAGTGLLPFSNDSIEAAITERAVAITSNLDGFRTGLELSAKRDQPPTATEGDHPSTTVPKSNEALIERARAVLPEQAMDLVKHGISRLIDYQDLAYAELYIDRLVRVSAEDRLHCGYENRLLIRETARYLALWMSYEDVMRVADLKSRETRIQRVRRESRAASHEPVRITEFLNPGIEEFTTVLPAGIGQRLQRWANQHNLSRRLHLPMHVRSDTVWGMMRLRFLARLKTRRRKSYRYVIEQDRIERWLEAIIKALSITPDLALGVVRCGRLIKGYSDTRERANRNFDQLFEQIVTPALAGTIDPARAANWLQTGFGAALADDEGKALATVLHKGPADSNPAVLPLSPATS